MASLGSRKGPVFADDDRFNPIWWRQNVHLGPPEHRWRSYVWRGEEVARMLLAMQFSRHWPRTTPPAVLVWSFEVREDMRCSGDHIGTRIVEELADELNDREIYIGPAPESTSFWTRLGWSMCNCDACRGQDIMVRHP